MPTNPLEHETEIENNLKKLGEKLEDIRVMKGYDLVTIAHDMRVTVDNLTDIEKGVKIMPKNPYIGRLITLKYVEVLGVSDNPAITELVDFVYSNKPTDAVNNKTINMNDFDFEKTINRSSSIKKARQLIIYIVGLVFVIVLIGVSLVSIYHYLGKASVDSTITNETTLVENTKLQPGNVVAAPEKTVVSYDKNEDSTNYYYNITSLVDPSKYTLKLVATGDCYVDVTDKATGKTIGDTGVLKKGDSFSYDIGKDQKEIYINLGASQYIEVYVNDLKVDLSKVDKGQNYVYLTNKVVG